MSRFVVCMSIILCVGGVVAQQVEISTSSSGSVVNARLDWQAIPGEAYSVESADSLTPASWTNLTGKGVLASNVLGGYETTMSGPVQFFRVTKHDTSPPEIEQFLPADEAVAVPSNAAVYVTLSDETGIDTNSLFLSVGGWTNMTMAGGMLSWSNGTVAFQPPSSLGALGSVVTNSITVADTLGHTLSNSTWTFQIDRTNVATDAFLPLTAPSAQSRSVIPGDKTVRRRSLPTVQPLSGTDEYHIIETTSNTVVFSYDTAPPAVSNGTLLVSFDAAYPLYCRVASDTATVDLVRHEITVSTTNLPLTAFVEETSISALDLTPAQGSSATRALSVGSLDLLHVEFGNDLSGTVIYEDAGLKIHLPDGAWSFVGDVDVAFDVAWGKLRALDASAGGKLTLTLTPEVLFRQAISGGDSTPLIAPITHIFGGMAGPVPVWVEVSMELNAGYTYSASVSGSVSTTVDTQKEIRFHLHLRDNEWEGVADNPPIVLVADPITWQLEGTANAKIYVQPKLTVLVYSLAGPWVDIKSYSEFDGWYRANPETYELGLYFGLSSTLGIESRIWYDGWGEKPEWTLFDQKWLLWSTSYPSDLAPSLVAAFPNRTVAEDADLTLSGQAAGVPTPSYRWYFNGSRIVGATTPEYEIASAQSGHQGTYTVQAYNTRGSVQTSCYVTVSSGMAPSGTVLMNEWMADNQSTIASPSGDYPAWFELYNPHTISIDLTGFSVTDDLRDQQKFKIPAGTIMPPAAYLFFWDDAGVLLRPGGGLLAVFSNGRLVDSISYGVQAVDVSEGRYPDGDGHIGAMVAPTPGYANAWITD